MLIIMSLVFLLGSKGSKKNLFKIEWIYIVMFWLPYIPLKNNCFLHQLFYKLNIILQILHYLKILLLWFLNLFWSCPKPSGKWLSNWRSLCWITAFILPCLPDRRNFMRTLFMYHKQLCAEAHRGTWREWWKIMSTENFTQLPFHKLFGKAQILV